jgi:hypothetical protein
MSQLITANLVHSLPFLARFGSRTLRGQITGRGFYSAGARASVGHLSRVAACVISGRRDASFPCGVMCVTG